MGFAFSQAFIGTGMFAHISGSPFVLQNIYGVSAQMFSMLFAINGAVLAILSYVFLVRRNA
ncbi:hypothetical protein P9E04_01130 [Bacillus halotolerans]|nr:hypothetical protein [Bacillus halotolerans]